MNGNFSWLIGLLIVIILIIVIVSLV